MNDYALLKSLASTSARAARRSLKPSSSRTPALEATLAELESPYEPADRCIRSPQRFNVRVESHSKGNKDANYARISRETREKINIAANGERHGWRHTKSLRGDEQRLKNTIRISQVSPRTTEADLSPPPIEDEELGYDGPSFIVEPGDYVESRRNASSNSGIVLGQEYESSRERYVILNTLGNISKPYKGDIMFHIPGFLSPELAQRCGREAVVADKATVLARVQALKRCRDFERQLEAKTIYFSNKIAELYDKVSSPDPDHWSTLTLGDAVSIIDKNKTRNSLSDSYAMHRCLINRPLQFLADEQYQTNLTFRVRPRSHIALVERVAELCQPRERANGFDSFVARALAVMKKNKERAKETHYEQPTSRPSVQPAWSSTDAIFIEFLKLALRPVRSTQVDPYQTSLTTILKALHPGESVIADDQTYETLVHLGVYAPWQDVVALRDDLPVSLHPKDVTERAAQNDSMVQKGLQTMAKLSPQDPIGPEDFYAADPLESVRHDFGDLPVYVVDDFGAHELDDGISIERIPDDPSSLWIHVHVANPTSLLPPNHFLAQQARAMGQSIYLVQGSELMLPSSFTQLFSLGEQTKKGLPEKVMSFSAKIDASGDVVDYKVRAGIIRNLHILRYDNVDYALGKPLAPVNFPLGHVDPRLSRLSLEGMTDRTLEDIKAIELVGKRILQQRLDKGIFQIDAHNAELTMNPGGFTELPDAGQEHRGFPELIYSVKPTIAGDTGARSIVAEAMKIAGRVASMFLRDKGIPSLRRCNAPVLVQNAENPNEAPDTFLSNRDPNTGYINEQQLTGYELFTRPAMYSLSPAEHWTLGIDASDGYCRVTSPLRRYSDLVCHWNLHQALLGSDKPVHPSLSSEWLEQLAQELPFLERHHKSLQRQNTRFWQCYALKRAMDDPRRNAEQIFGSLEGFRFNPITLHPELGVLQSQARVPSLGLRAPLHGLTEENKSSSLGVLQPMVLSSIVLGMKPNALLKLR